MHFLQSTSAQKITLTAAVRSDTSRIFGHFFKSLNRITTSRAAEVAAVVHIFKGVLNFNWRSSNKLHLSIFMEFKMMLWLQQLQANYNLISIHKKQELEFCLHFLVFEKHIPGKQKWKVRFGRKSDLLLSGLKFLPCCSKMVLKEFLLREIVSQVTPKEMIGNRRENEISIIGFSSDHFFVIFSICPKMFYSHCFQFLKCLIISLQTQTIFFHF